MSKYPAAAADSDASAGDLISLASEDPDALMAMVIAMAARNGVEDLHAAGVFSDAQAPDFNRRVRNRVYEMLLAIRHQTPDPADPFTAYIGETLETAHRSGEPATDATGQDALVAAVACAVREFATAEQLPQQQADQLQDDAVESALAHAIKPMNRLDQPTAQRQITYLATMIPSYWERPAVSKELAALCGHDAPARD